jgi:hypothetical protein
MLKLLRWMWRNLPKPVRVNLEKTGIPYALSYYSNYATMHHNARFAGNLMALKEKRPTLANERKALHRSFDAIFDSIVLANGVRKTTCAGRQVKTLEQFLGRAERPREGSCIRVLDIPCSTGISSIDSYNVLRRHYEITSYTIADLCLEILYDPNSNCIYDRKGRLLQVGGKRRFFSTYLSHSSSAEFTLLSKLLLAPNMIRSFRLRRRHPIDPNSCEVLRLLHPETEQQIEQGVFTVREMDIFSVQCEDEFDLVLSFNLLQQNYFAPAEIAQGLQNLGKALTEGGFLITGNTESFAVMCKIGGKLQMQYQRGEW